jgi:hypothetical protein
MPDNPYADIIDLPHHVSKVHPQMSMHQRAAQFSPFAALVGYEDVVHEMERQTDQERELSEDEKAELDQRMGIIAAHLSEHPVVTIEYFVPDKRKDGGEYVFKSGEVEKIVPTERVVVVGGKVIRMDRIVGIEGKLFEGEF